LSHQAEATTGIGVRVEDVVRQQMRTVRLLAFGAALFAALLFASGEVLRSPRSFNPLINK
jgi:hypothetical protein